jgi:hypothetical protein
MTIFSFLRPSITLVLIALTLFLLVSLAGCRFADSSGTEQRASINAVNSVSSAPTIPEVNVFVDEVMLAKPYAVIGGTVQNVSATRLEKLSVDIELRRREDNSLVKREVNIEPSDLAPGEKGKFSLKVISNEWSGSRILSLRSGARKDEVAFKSLPGAKRPPEKLAGKVVEVQTPRKRTKPNGEEFLNTPDTPVKVP